MNLYQLAIIDCHNKGYLITKKGEILNPKNKIVNGSINLNGYKCFSYRFNNKIIKINHHRLQAYQKYNKVIFENGIVVRHKDDNKLNNNFDNILIGTQLDNVMDKTPMSRLKSALIATSYIKIHDHSAILKRRSEGATYSKLMEEFNISSKGTLSFIINNSNDKL